MDKLQLRDMIDNTLYAMGGKFYSEEAINLLMGTAAVESGLGKFIRQISGPALGIFQMEPATFKYHLGWIYSQGNTYSDKFFDVCNVINESDPEILVYNLKAAIMFTRIHYWRVPHALPSTIEDMAHYWKQYYNTPLGKGTDFKFIECYKKYVL